MHFFRGFPPTATDETMPTAFIARDKSQGTNYQLSLIHHQLKKLYWTPFSGALGIDA